MTTQDRTEESFTKNKDTRQQQGSPQAQGPAFGGCDSNREAVTPEAQLQGHAELEGIASEALQLSQEIANQLASTPPIHTGLGSEDDTSQSSGSSQQLSISSPQLAASSSPQVAGMGTPLDFTAALNLDEFDSSTLVAASTVEEATFGTARSSLKSHLLDAFPCIAGTAVLYLSGSNQIYAGVRLSRLFVSCCLYLHFCQVKGIIYRALLLGI